MSNRTLDRLILSRPCDADWDSMHGNDQVRFCEHCNLQVTNLSSITRAEARRVVAESRGRICVRFIVAPGGGVLTQKMPEKLHRISRRAARIAAGAFSASLSLSTAAGQTRVISSAQPPESSELVKTNCEREEVGDEFSARVTGAITAADGGAAIANARVFLVDRESGEERTTTSSSTGQYSFQVLPAGNYLLWVHQPAFRTARRSLSVAAGGGVQEDFELYSRTLYSLGGAMMSRLVEEEPLLKAIQAGDVDDVRRLLSVPVKFGRIARATLHLSAAVQGGNRQIVQLLLEAGADPNFRVEGNDPALLSLSEKATPELVQDLILAGAKLNARNDYGDNALIIASRSSNEQVVKELVNAGVQINATNSAGETALFVAARNSVAVMTLLLDAGININHTDESGDNALMATLPGGSFENFKMLFDRGADWTGVNHDGQTALILAAENEEPEIAKFLIERGLRLDAQDTNGTTALTMAAGSGHEKTARLLISAGADLNLRNSSGRTALMFAATSGRVEIVRLLLDGGADPTVKDADGKTALAYARESEEEDVILAFTSRNVRQ